MTRGNCYVTCEALYHLLGGKAAGYTPHCVYHEGDTHWYLVKSLQPWSDGLSPIIIDPTASQFHSVPPYHKGRGRGFLTKKPSKRAQELMKKLVYQ